MAFTEFFCHTTGNNLNGGGLVSLADPSDAAAYTGVGDSDGTSVFTPSDGSTPASTVNVGDWASVYVTAGATVATFIGRVTVVATGVNGAITVSTTAKSGTIPTNSAGAHTITCKVGGAWKGPNAAVGFPFGFITAAQANLAGDSPRVNFIGGTNYPITAAITHSLAGPVKFQGYTATAGDGGKFTIDGTIVGAAYILLLLNGNQLQLEDCVIQNNGTTGTGVSIYGLNFGSNLGTARRVVANNIRGHGINGTGGRVVECEAYACNLANTVNIGGFTSNDRGGRFIRCYSHNNSGSNASGFVDLAGTILVDCIFESNGQHGVDIFGNNLSTTMTGCDCYNNGGSGVDIGNAAATNNGIYAENCNFVKNTLFGVNGSNNGPRAGYLVNCGFGTGSQVNGSGSTNTLGAIENISPINYASGATPWNAPATGDFRIVLGAAIAAGRGSFTQTGSSKTGTVAYPDIGAAQHRPLVPCLVSTSARGAGMASYKPGDSYAGEFVTSNPFTGASVAADSLPAGTMTHNGTDDGTVTVTVTAISGGRYKATATVPVGYAAGDAVQVSIAATVATVAGAAVIDSFVLDSKRAADLHDYAGGDTSGTTTLLARIPGTVQPQTGDSYALIGATGSGLTSLAPAATALSTGVWTNALAVLLAQLTFTHANVLDANIHYVNDVKVNGVGTVSLPWGP